MRPQQPPSSPGQPASPVSQACTVQLGLMVEAADELAFEIGLGASPGADRIAAELLAGLRPVVPELARERACGRAMTHLMLDDVADKLESVADRRGYWPRHTGDRPPLPNETQLRALIARLRIVARN